MSLWKKIFVLCLDLNLLETVFYFTWNLYKGKLDLQSFSTKGNAYKFLNYKPSEFPYSVSDCTLYISKLYIDPLLLMVTLQSD